MSAQGATYGTNGAAFASTVRPPRWPVAAAVACLVASLLALILAAAGDQSSILPIAGVGYLLGSIGVAVFIVIHRMRKQRAQQSNWYEPRRGVAVAAKYVLALGLLAGAGNAFLLATEIAKR